MSLYVIIEPFFQQSSWCQDIMAGLQKEVSRKRLVLTCVDEPGHISKLENIDDSPPTLFIVGSRLAWIHWILKSCLGLQMNPIIISNQPTNTLENGYSYVSSDINGSVSHLMYYLKSIGRKNVALYGVNTDSLADISKTEAFISLLVSQTNKNKDSIFLSEGSLNDCFHSFYPYIDHFDSIICVNDYAAISLIQKLKTKAPEKLDDLYIASFSDTLISKLYTPSITSLSFNFRDFGKAAIAIYEILNKNPGTSSIHMLIKWQLRIRETTKSTPYNAAIVDHIMNGTNGHGNDEFNFYKDTEIKDLILIENLLNRCDSTDLAILTGIMKNMTYQQISDDHYLSAESVKYRIKKMVSHCNFKLKSELIELLIPYINIKSMEEYGVLMNRNKF